MHAVIFEAWYTPKRIFNAFEHARTVSGDTTDALAAIQSGCLPLDHETGGGRAKALSTSTATEFKSRGVDTVSFPSWDLVSRVSNRWNQVVQYAQVLACLYDCYLFRSSNYYVSCTVVLCSCIISRIWLTLHCPLIRIRHIDNGRL